MEIKNNNWSRKHFSEIVQIIGGGTPKTSVKEYWNGDINWLSVVDFNDDYRKVYTTEKTITEKGLKESSTKLLNKGDIIISARGTVGAIAQLGKEMAFNQSCYGLREINNVSINDYIYYLLKYKLKNIKGSTHGSVFDTITKNTFDLIEVNLPSIEEQKAIAKVLSELDDKIEINKKINDNLEELGQAIFKRWFVDFDFPNQEGEPYQSSGGEMVESELGLIPKDWNVVDLNTELDFVTGIEPGRNNYNFEKIGKIFIRVGNLTGMRNEELYTDIETDKTCEKNDVIVSFDGTIGIVKVGFEGIFSTGIKKIIPLNESNYKQSLVYFLMKSNQIQNTINEYSNGTTIKHAGKSVRFMKFFESNKITKQFSNELEPIYNQILNIVDEIESLKQIRDSLLPKLMSGEIRVK